MAQNILKAKGRGVAPKKAKTVERKIILVGTYREGQLAWIGKHLLYNYPVREGDKFDARALGKVSELWLYAGTKAKRHCYEAKFVRQMTREEWLKENPTYRKKVKGRGQEEKVKVKGEGEQRNDNPLNSSGTNKAYYVFEVKPLEYGTRFDAPEVITRVADFGGRSAKIKKAIEQYEKDGKFASLAAYLPTELSQVPKSQLRVCEPLVQMDFLSKMLPLDSPPISKHSVTDMESMCRLLGCKYGTPGWPDDFGNGLRRFFDRKPGRRIRTLSLFSGAGGLDIGFSDAGFDIVDSVEIEKKFCATLELNSGEGKRFNHSKVNCIDIRMFSGRELGRIDFIIGGPPCQTFSAAGRRANGVLGTTDARGVLFREYVRLLRELNPRGFLFENVYGLTGAQGGEAWQEIQDSFAEAGYAIFSRILDAADFGVPQHRERLIIVGVRNGSYKFPRPTHGPDSLSNTPFYTAGTAIYGLKLTDEEKKPGLGGRFGHLLDDIPPGLNYSYYTKEMGHPNPLFAWRSKFSDFLYKADPDAPVRTIKAQGGAYTGPLHWDNRFFAYSEYKRLQTFPDDYEISGGKQVAVQQIGNSVPPQLARILAISIQSQLFGVSFPFQLSYLDPEDKLTFRSHKLRMMDAYRKKARAEISNIPKSNSVHAPFNCEFFCRISDHFKFDKCEPTNGDYRIAVRWADELKLDVSDFGRSPRAKIGFTIEIRPSKMAWDLPFTRVIMKSHSSRINSFTVAWKALENIIASKGVKADLVQLNGYYQYSPELCSKCSFSVPFKYSDVISQIVSGENVRRIVPESELAESWGVSRDNVVNVAVALREIGYEIRNNKTNPQIEPGQWLIPYAFPTLNHMSVQLRKEVK